MLGKLVANTGGLLRLGQTKPISRQAPLEWGPWPNLDTQRVFRIPLPNPHSDRKDKCAKEQLLSGYGHTIPSVPNLFYDSILR